MVGYDPAFLPVLDFFKEGGDHVIFDQRYTFAVQADKMMVCIVIHQLVYRCADSHI